MGRPPSTNPTPATLKWRAWREKKTEKSMAASLRAHVTSAKHSVQKMFQSGVQRFYEIFGRSERPEGLPPTMATKKPAKKTKKKSERPVGRPRVGTPSPSAIRSREERARRLPFDAPREYNYVVGTSAHEYLTGDFPRAVVMEDEIPAPDFAPSSQQRQAVPRVCYFWSACIEYLRSLFSGAYETELAQNQLIDVQHEQMGITGYSSVPHHNIVLRARVRAICSQEFAARAGWPIRPGVETCCIIADPIFVSSPECPSVALTPKLHALIDFSTHGCGRTGGWHVLEGRDAVSLRAALDQAATGGLQSLPQASWTQQLNWAIGKQRPMLAANPRPKNTCKPRRSA